MILSKRCYKIAVEFLQISMKLYKGMSEDFNTLKIHYIILSGGVGINIFVDEGVVRVIKCVMNGGDSVNYLEEFWDMFKIDWIFVQRWGL